MIEPDRLRRLLDEEPTASVEVRALVRDEFAALGRMMVDVHSQLEGFPSPAQQPAFYRMLTNIGDFTERTETKVLVAISELIGLVGGVVYFGDMTQYGMGSASHSAANTSGIRFLTVCAEARGLGVGKALAGFCLDLARGRGHSQVFLHSTNGIPASWSFYQRLGFERAAELDLARDGLQYFGFRRPLAS